ncbi:signal recognition particle subunit srp68 [Homalodisca vitripennis]|nr:signal recognition particle subunit srp68 [Homalodisca vitripennis]
MVYEKLQSALSEEEQVVYKQRCDELAPSLRYCAYNIGDQSAMDDLLSLRSQAHGELLDNLDTLVAQTRDRRTEVLSETTWRGRTFPVRPERVRLFLLADRDLTTNQDVADASIADRIEQLERHLMDCKDALAAARDELKNDPASKGKSSSSGGPLSPLQYLVSYITYIRLSRNIQRNNLMVQAAKTSLSDKAASAEVTKYKPVGN